MTSIAQGNNVMLRDESSTQTIALFWAAALSTASNERWRVRCGRQLCLSDNWQQGADLGLVPGITAHPLRPRQARNRRSTESQKEIQASGTRDIGVDAGNRSLIFLLVLTPP